MTGLSVDSIYEMEGKTDSFDRSFALYYEKLYFFYKMYDFCYRELEELNFDEFTDEDKLALKDKVEKEKIRVLLELCGQDKKKRRDVFLNFSQSLDGEEAENHKLHTFKKNIEDRLNPEFQGRFKIMLVPNVTNICYGRGVGYKIEEIVLPDEIQKISATKIRAKMREEGKLK